jgi:hypothetical protein
VNPGELILFGEVVQEPTKRRDDQGETLGQRERTHVTDHHDHPFPHLWRVMGKLLP